MKPKKLIALVIFIWLFFAFYSMNFAYARGGGGCFVAGTSILTPSGERSIETLHQGDRVVSYNWDTQKTEAGIIGKIEIISAPEYLLIDRHIKVTPTHPFYVRTSQGIKLTEAQYLKIGDRLIKKKDFSSLISSIDRIREKNTVYNLCRRLRLSNYGKRIFG